MRRTQRIIGYSIAFLILALVSSPFVFSYFYVPDRVQVAVGKENKLDFNIPFSKPIYIKELEEGERAITLSMMGVVPIKSVSVEAVASREVIPSGKVVAVDIESEGVYILGVAEVQSGNTLYAPCKDQLKEGDFIMKVNNEKVSSKEALKELVEQNGSKVMRFEVKRKGEKHVTHVTPIYVNESDDYKLGLWIKDGMKGIGTVTYIDPKNQTYGALGHGITDTKIKKLIPIKGGEIMRATITSITKGEEGVPGQLGGSAKEGKQSIMGDIDKNSTLGIYGELNEIGNNYFEGKAIPIAYQNEVHAGEASILIALENDKQELFTATIQKMTKYSAEPTKSIVIQITDPGLIEKTGGIVQGMSGSPILQDGKLIGAITHVFVNDPTKGYGIFIENMLEESDTIN